MSQLFETARGTVHAWQRDHMGHVNVRAYGEFFEEASWQVYNRIGITPSRLRAGDIHMAAVQQDTSYRRELLAGDVISVHSGVLEMRDRVLRFVHELRNDETNEISAISVFTVVCIDPEKRRSRAFPPDVIAAARSLVVEYPAPGDEKERR